MLRGGGMLHITILSLLATLASAGVKGFGIIFSVEPMKGSTGGGTEIHVAGAGFAYVTQVLVGGKPCHILEQMTKDGELTAFTPALPAGRHDVEVVFTSGHRAKLRDGQFLTHARYTPVVNYISQASAVIHNITWTGDLKKMLELNMNDIFEDTGEKRNATEIMHAYLGTGIEILSDKAGRDEYRCDILETPTENAGVCEVSAGTPAGYYNFTYVLQNGVSMNGYGKSVWEVQGLPYVSMEGQEYAIEVYPTIHSLRTKQVGRMGGAPVFVEADGIFVGKQDFAERHEIVLDGVPCKIEDIENLGNTQVLQCTPGATTSRPTHWPKRLAVGSWAAAWEAAERMGPFPGMFLGTVERKLKRSWKVIDQMEFQQAGHICSGARHRLGSTSSLEECAENCFFMNCRFFDFRRETRECRWCADVAADGTMSTYDPGWIWHPQTIGGVYKLNIWLDKYLRDFASEGPNWKLLHGDGRTRCGGSVWYGQSQVMTYRMGGFIQQCADWCSSQQTNTNGGNCTYFGILSHLDSGRSARCVLYSPDNGLQQPEERLTGGKDCVPTEDTWIGHFWTVFELTRETPMAPPPSGIYPGGRGALVRVWNLCPKGNAFNWGCNHARRSGFAALHASLNPEYREQKPMLEVVRTDVLRGAFGFEHARYADPSDLVAYDKEGPYATMAEAAGDHGITEEIMAFFVAPVTGYYSFLTWGDQAQDVWLSRSSDPADLVKVATQLRYQGCRSSSSRRRNTYAGCSIFYNYRSDDSRYWDSNEEAHEGTNLTRSFGWSGEDLGYRTPTEQTMYLTKGERRFFVKRTVLAEDFRPGGFESRRRRRARQFTGLRISQPDLSEKTPEQKALLSERKSWPETLVFKKIIEKTDGQWRVGLRETVNDEPTWSSWIFWNFNEWHLTEALNAMVLPSGTQVASEGWWMNSYQNPLNSAETVTEYMIHIWRPGGDLPPVLIEYDLMRSRVEVAVASNGNGNDLFLWPLSASLFEVPTLESSMQLSVTGVTAVHSPRVTADSNMSNATENDEEMMIPFPCVQGQFSATSCSDALGCAFSSAVSGLSTYSTLDATQLYDTLEECQQRCCHDEDCFGVSYDSATKYCTKHAEYQDHRLESSATGVYVSVTSRQPSSDGFAAYRGRMIFEGVQVGAYAGHRSVTFCKEKCAAEPLCNSFAYHETTGCMLRSLCVTADSLRGDIWNGDDARWVYYKTQGRCAEVWDWSEADRTTAFFPTDPFGSSHSTMMKAYPGRRRNRWNRYNLGSLMRTQFSYVTAQDLDSDPAARLLSDDEPMWRRLSSACEENCTDVCNNTSDSSDNVGEDGDCLSDCLLNNCGIEAQATNTSTTQTMTSTTSTTLPPPPVRLVQLSGDVFNVGDPMPAAGLVSGRVEVFYNGEWGTVCKDNFGATEASVVCSELGLTDSFALATTEAQAGSPGSESQPILLDEVSCTGMETHLSLCGSDGWGVHNCFHSEDIKVTCNSASTTQTTVTQTSFTVTTTTSTTTSFQTVMVAARTGLLRQELTGRCVGPTDCSTGATLFAEECKLYVPDQNNPQKWNVNSWGQMESTGCAGMCISLEGESLSWSDRYLVMKPCEDPNMTIPTLQLTQQRFFFHASSAPGLVQNQFTGKCMDTEGSNGRDEKQIMFRECEETATCHARNMKWEPLNMPGQSRSTATRIETCQQRCASVQGCAHFSWWANGGCHLQDSNARLIFDNNAYSGPPSCSEMVTDQRFAFVDVAMSTAPTRGMLRNAETLKCLDPQDLDNTVLQLGTCDMQTPDSDQEFELLNTGELQNVKSGLCATVTDPQDGTDPVVSLTTCGSTSTFQRDSLDLSQLMVSGRCVNSSTGDDGASIVTMPCTGAESTNMTLSWEFVTSTGVATRCAELCKMPDLWDIWLLQSNALSTCECGHLFRERDIRWELIQEGLLGNIRWELIQEGLLGSAELNAASRFGLLTAPQVELVRLNYPTSVKSSLAPAFTASDDVDLNQSQGLGVFSMDVSLPQEIPESGEEPTTAFGFSYLSEAYTPYVDSISVNGASAWTNYTVTMTDGDAVVIHGRNFDGLMDADVKVYLGMVEVPSVTVTGTSVSFTAPLTTYGPIVMQVMVGWKGWADFAPFLQLPYPQQQDHLNIQFDSLNQLTAVTPSVGSMVGGTQVTITGKGFQLPGLSNVVELYHYGGDLMGQMAGACNVSSGSLTSIQCQMPTFDLSHWASTQFEERMEVRVNGQRLVHGSDTPLLFKYSRPHTPIVIETKPESLSFALTNNITVIGFNFGLLKREVEVMIGNRSCKIWDVNQTHINCQLKRSAMALPPLCTENKDIYNEDCVVKPHNFFQKPNLLVTSRGYSVSQNSSFLDTRFEIHSVDPPVGSEEGGARVTVRGVGFGNRQLTPQLTIAALGTLGDVESWSDTEVVFTTRKLTLNVAKVDLMVNLISAKHKCGSGPDAHPGTTTTTTMGQNISLNVAPVVEVITSEDCEHRAFRAYVTPNVTAVSAVDGNEGDVLTFTVSMPPGYNAGIVNGSVSVHLGSHVCPHVVDSKIGDTLTISCTVPAFEASTVPIKVRILPLGYARNGDGLDKFTQLLTVDAMTPNSGSKGGIKVQMTGKGFSTNPKRHFVRVGSEFWGLCEPLASSYSSLTCFLNFQNVDQASVSGGSQQVEVMLWDTEVSNDPLSAFGNTQTGCMRGENDWRRYNVATQEECALHCLTTASCRSFDFSARYQRCFMSDTSFTRDSDADDQRQKHCRYFERRSEEDSSVVVSVTKNNFFTYSDSKTPNIELVYTLPSSDSALLQGTATGCTASAADLGSGNSGCCSTDTPCGVDEGVCSSDSRCAGDLMCVSYSCSWTTSDADMQDSCCVLQGSDSAFATQEPLWAPADRVYVRVSSLGDAATAVTNDPSGGAVNISFAGVPCPIDVVRSFSGESWIDLGCALGPVPGGLAAFPTVHSDQGVTLDQYTWIFTSLTVNATEPVHNSILASESSLGGGWTLRVNGSGFAPPKSEGADTFVEVTVCGRPCEVVNGSDTSLDCVVPNVTTPAVLSAAADAAIVLPASRVLTRNAGTVSDAPLCFHGVGENHFEVGHSTCAAVFDDDPEVVGGTTGTGCHVGVDFGKYSNARVEKIRWHPLYDFLEADSYINGKFQVGSLVEPQTCDELSYGWRGVEYRGCQDVSERGNPCMSWADKSFTDAELVGHSYCRNPWPGSRNRGIWCYLQKGGWEYCNPKVPEITWTDVYSVPDTPKMLWNDVVLSTPVLGRFVRFVSPSGNCQIQEMQVVGQLVAPADSCEVAVRNVRSLTGPNMHMDLRRLAWRGGIHYYQEFPQAMSEWVSNSDAFITFSVSKTPTVTHISPMNGTARGGTSVTIHGTNFGPAWTVDPADPTAATPVTVEFNGYACDVQEVTTSSVVCVTMPRNDGIKAPSMRVTVEGAGNAWIKPGTRYRYLDRWSLLDTWANQEPPIEDALVSIPQGQAILLDEDTPVLLILTVEGVLVFDNRDIHLQASYIWVKGGTMEIGTEQKPFLHRALVTLHGQKYSTIRLPVIGGKVLAVSNTQFTIRELGDNAVEEGNIGTLDIHGKPRIKVWTRLAQTANKGDTVIVLQDVVDWQSGEELMVAATDIPHKHFDGNGLHGAPPVDFHNERVYVQSVASDMKTITLTAPLKYTHISTHFTRPLDDEYIDLSAEVALLSRNVKIQGEAWHSERDQWGGHTMVAFGGIYRLENAEFYRLGQTGEVSRYPIHFHITQDYGKDCYARYNSIHHSFQRAVAIHSTNYVNVKGNVAFDIIGHMFFIETGMEMHNTLEGNLGVGAIPLLSGMLESDQEPAGFWTAAPNNVWRDNVAVTGSDGWYFQLPDTPISHNMDIYKDSICPVGTRIGEWRRNRCHHLPGSCIRIYLTWIPRKEPCKGDSAEDPQILFNTTCWDIGKACYNAMKMGSVHNHHMTAVEGGKQDYESIKFIRTQPAEHGNKFETDFVNIPHIKDSVFVRILPENLETKRSGMQMSVQLPQNEQFYVADSMWINTGETPVFKGCAKCWSFVKWRQGAHTYRMTGLSFTNATRRIQVYKKDIYWDLDGSLTGTADSYTTWADAFNLGHPDCVYTQVSFNTSEDGTKTESTWYSDTGMSTDSPGIFKTGENIYQHEVRNHTFMTCTTPIRKLGIAWPEPQEVHLRQLTVTNLDTGLFQQHEFEKLELFGWGFPVVANQRLEVRPNFLGMDLTEAGVQYGFNDLLASKEGDALKNKQTPSPEWLQLQLKFWMNYDHVKLTNPYSWWVGTRYGETAELQSVRLEEKKPYLTDPTPLDSPQSLPSMTHGMKDQTTWAMSFRYPKPADGPAWEAIPYGAHFQARKCPDEGCILNLPARDQTWENYTLWSEKFGDVTGQAVEIDSYDWIMFDLELVVLKNLTIKGKLSFDDSQNRVLRTGNILVWGELEIGTSSAPFGATTGTTARVELTGNVLETADYVYIQEQSLWGKVVTIIGKVNTYGAPVTSTWLRVASTISSTDETACLKSSTDPGWKSGSVVAFSVTEFDNPWSGTMTRTLTSDAVYESASDCWRISWSGNLQETRFADDVAVGNGNTVSLRAVVAKVDRSVVFASHTVDTTGGSAYGGHIEIIDLTLDDLAATKWVGTVDLRYTHFDTLGKGALSAAVKVTYSSNFEPPPVISFHGCSWSNSQEYPLHLESANVPTLITENVMVHSYNGGIFLQTGAAVHMKDNAILGLALAPTAPRAIAEDDSEVIVMQYAGIRADEMPVRMIGNVVAGSDDMGYMHPAEQCPPRGIFNNEATGTVTGVFLLTQKSGSCQTINLYTIWKAAHVALYLSDVLPPQTQLNNIVVADSHIGIIPYMSVGSAFRRLYLRNTIFIGTSPAGTDCTRSVQCRTQTLTDPYMTTCSSMYTGSNFRRVGFVTAIQTKNRKSCWTSKPAYQCRLMSPAQPSINNCHQPWEKDIHMQKGLGWTYFEDTTFAYFKSSDCGMTDRALAPNMWGAEVNFPATFTRTTWYESDMDARFELSTEVLDDSYSMRASPCKSSGGGCMGLDQLLFQDMDGTLTGLDASPMATVLPLTPRTDIVWAPMCDTSLNGVAVGAQVCANTTVDLLEMINLDRGAKDVKFGPLVLTPDVPEDNGFQGGVLSSVGPFYASCPCGWDFSFYHVLIKPDTTYYAEVMSLPENFRLRYWSPRAGDTVLLEIFYPDSRGVNVFVGAQSEPDMALRLGRKPTHADPHGSHVVDAQALRLYVTLHGSPEGFNAQRDVVIRRTPTVKLKMNIEISIEEFNADQFQTNLAILLGIPPERIVVASVSARRRLSLLDTSENDADLDLSGMPCDSLDGCITPRRRLAVSSQTALDISISPSTDAVAAASGGDSTSTGADALNAQTNELTEVSSNIASLSTSPELAAAVGAEVSVSDIEPPAIVDEAANEQVPSASEVAEVQVVDVTAVATTSGNAEVSAEAPCLAAFGVTVTVGSTISIVYLSTDLANAGTTTSLCGDVDSGYEGNIVLSCSAGTLKANVGSCSPISCTTSSSVSVTVGGTTASVSPSADLASGIVSSLACSSVNSDYTGNYDLYCNLGVLTFDVTSCSPGCGTGSSITLTVAGSTSSWSPSATMTSGDTASTDCEPINSGYMGTLAISCFFGVLSANPSSCVAKPCAAGSTISVTLDGVTNTLTTASEIKSGFTGTAACADVNSAWGNDLTLRCTTGSLSADISTCEKACASTDTVDLTLNAVTVAISPSSTIASGGAEYNRPCSEINSGFSGTYTLSCTTGSLAGDLIQCAEAGCDATQSVSVTVGDTTIAVATGEALEHGGSVSQLCEAVNSAYTGTLSISCSYGAVSLASSSCEITPCEPWHFVAATLHDVSGLLYPREQIASGASGVGECGDVNVEYSGDFTMSCVNGALQADSGDACRRTCSTASVAQVTLDGTTYDVSPAFRVAHGGTGVQACGNVRYGYGGEVQLACDDGTLTVTSEACLPEPCPVGLLIETTIWGVKGIGPLVVNASHLGTGLVDCSSINPETVGFFEAVCVAKSLTLVDDTVCLRSCTADSTVNLTLDGYSYTVAPVDMITHNTTDTQNCSDFSSGYSGTLDLMCVDNVTTVVSNACVPNPCPDPRTNEQTLVDAYTEYTEECSTIDSMLRGDIAYSCIGGQIRTNTSGCNAPCNESSVHGANIQVACSGFLGSQYDGSVNLTCADGSYLADSSACVRACLVGETDTVVVNGVSHMPTVTSRLSSGNTETLQCSTLDSAYSGTFDLSCSNGLLSDTPSCHEMCLTTDSVSAMLRGQTYTVSPVSNILHGATGNVPCSDHLSGYVGNIVLTCTEGSLQADGSGCEAPCAVGSSLSVTFGGEAHTATLTSQIQSGSTGSESCASADPGFNGNIVISCADGTASWASFTCTEKPCAQDLGYSLTVGGVSATENLPSWLNHGDTTTVACGNVATGWGGDVTVTCIKGAAIPDYSSCLPACVLGTTIDVVLGVDGSSYSTASTEQISHGASGTQSCEIAHPGFEGNIVLSCNSGGLTMDSNTCVEKPCLQNMTYRLFLGDRRKTFSLQSELSHSDTVTHSCSSVNAEYDRDFQATCNKSEVIGDFSSCLLACTQQTVGEIQLGPELEKVSPSARMAGNGSTFTENCSAIGMQHEGTFEATCSAGVLSIRSSCIAGCGVGLTGQVTLDGSLHNFQFELDSLDGQVTTQACPPGFSSMMTIRCNGGYAEMQNHSCVPLPCPALTVSGEFDGSYNISETQADYAHNESFTEQCAWANPGYTGSFQATCKYGNITGNYSDCVGLPCPAGTNMDVTVGWKTLSAVQHPSGRQVDHGTVWTVPCSTVNNEFVGDVSMRCSGTNFRADTSACTQIEVGCLPTGLGEQITVVNHTVTLLPATAVASGVAFARDCGEVTNDMYVGTISATCGDMGRYTGFEISCVPRSCATGLDVVVAKGALVGTVTTSFAMAHLSAETTTCQSADEAMRGDLRLVCQFGTVVPDTSNCDLVCLPSRPGQVIMGKRVINVTAPEEVADTKGFFTQCASLYPGFAGTAQVTCNGGALAADVTTCQGLPCETGDVTNVTLYDITKPIAITQNLAHEAEETAECSVVNPDYSGTYKLNCFADAVAYDASTCVCQADGCSDAPCAATQTFFVALSGIQETRTAGKQLTSLESTSLPCGSVVPGHNGDMTVTCNAGILVPDVSGCSAMGCTPSGTPVEAVVGGATLEVSAPKELQHNEVFAAESCSNVSSGYSGEVKVTCFLGALVVDGASCVPMPCQDEVREITVAGMSMTVSLAGDNLGSTSPAPSGFQGAGTCSQLSDNLLGSFTVGCTASVFNLDLTQCTLKSCEPPASATAGLGASTQVFNLDLTQCTLKSCEPPASATAGLGASTQSAVRLGEQYEHDCQSPTEGGRNCSIGCALGWGGAPEVWLCLGGELTGTLPNCTLLPVYASVKGSLNLEVADPLEFVKDPNAKRGVALGIAEMCQVNESEVNVTLEVVVSSEIRRLEEEARRFLRESLARKLQQLAVKVDYTVNTEVADQSQAISKGQELVQLLSLPSDQQFAQVIQEAITTASNGESSYAVAVTERQADVQVVIGDEVFSPEELMNMSNFTTTAPIFEAPPAPWNATPLVVSLVVVSILGVCVGSCFGRWFVRRKAAGQASRIWQAGRGGSGSDLEVPDYSAEMLDNQLSHFGDPDADAEGAGAALSAARAAGNDNSPAPSANSVPSEDRQAEVPQEGRVEAGEITTI